MTFGVYFDFTLIEVFLYRSLMNLTTIDGQTVEHELKVETKRT